MKTDLSLASTSRRPHPLGKSLALAMVLALPLPGASAADYIWTGSTTYLDWASGNWSGTPAANPATGPTASDNYAGSTGSTSIALRGDRTVVQFLQPDWQTTTMLIVSSNNTTNPNSVFTAGSITNASGQLLTFRNGGVSSGLDVVATNVTISGAGNLVFGSSATTANAQATNAIRSLNVSGTTALSSSGKLLINVTEAEYTLGILDVNAAGEVSLNHSQWNKSDATAVTYGLKGTGGYVQNASTNAENASTLLVRNTADFSTSTVIRNGVGTLSLVKEGAGRQTLEAVNDYTGTTQVKEGTLVIGENGGLSNTSGITVSAGASLIYNNSGTGLTRALDLVGNGASQRAILGGNGTIEAAIALDNLGDTLAAGDNGIGRLQFSTTQTWSSFTYDWQLGSFGGTAGGSDYDQIGIIGSLNLTGAGESFSLLLSGDANIGFSEGNASWTILTASEGIVGFDAAQWNLDLSQFLPSGGWQGQFALMQQGNDLVLTYTAVPEASSLALLLGPGMLGAWVLARKRR